MFDCLARPVPPGSGDSDAQLATYIVGLVLAHSDCEGQLETIEGHLRANGVNVIETGKTGD